VYRVAVDAYQEYETTINRAAIFLEVGSFSINQLTHLPNGYSGRKDIETIEFQQSRRKITQSPPTEDMSNGWLAQPGVSLFDRESGRFTPREQADYKP